MPWPRDWCLHVHGVPRAVTVSSLPPQEDMTMLTRRGRRAEAGRGSDKKPDGEDEAAADRELSEDNADGSKDIRLTLMEEVLLLGLKDKEVRARPPCPRGSRQEEGSCEFLWSLFHKAQCKPPSSVA